MITGTPQREVQPAARPSGYLSDRGLLGVHARRARGYGRCALCWQVIVPGERVATPAGRPADVAAHLRCIAGSAPP